MLGVPKLFVPHSIDKMLQKWWFELLYHFLLHLDGFVIFVCDEVAKNGDFIRRRLSVVDVLTRPRLKGVGK